MDFPISAPVSLQPNRAGRADTTLTVEVTHYCALPFSGIFDRHVPLVSLRTCNYPRPYNASKHNAEESLLSARINIRENRFNVSDVRALHASPHLWRSVLLTRVLRDKPYGTPLLSATCAVLWEIPPLWSFVFTWLELDVDVTRSPSHRDPPSRMRPPSNGERQKEREGQDHY